MKDEIVEEVRKARDEFAARHNYDISAICAAIRELQNTSGRKIVSRRQTEDNVNLSAPPEKREAA